MTLTQDDVVKNVIELVGQVQEDMLGAPQESAGLDTSLVADLEFTSVDIMHLLASVEMRFQHQFQFDGLVMQDDQYVPDLTVRQLVEFISTNLGRQQRTGQAMG